MRRQLSRPKLSRLGESGEMLNSSSSWSYVDKGGRGRGRPGPKNQFRENEKGERERERERESFLSYHCYTTISVSAHIMRGTAILVVVVVGGRKPCLATAAAPLPPCLTRFSKCQSLQCQVFAILLYLAEFYVCRVA